MINFLKSLAQHPHAPNCQRGGLHASIIAAALASFLTAARAENVMRIDENSASAPFWAAAFDGRRIVEIASRDIGKTAKQLGLPRRLWCADAANRWRKASGLRVTGSRRAIDQQKFGRRINQPVVGAFVITKRRGGHHVDVIKQVIGRDIITIGGNVRGRVVERVRKARGIFVLPEV